MPFPFTCPKCGAQIQMKDECFSTGCLHFPLEKLIEASRRIRLRKLKEEKSALLKRIREINKKMEELL